MVPVGHGSDIHVVLRGDVELPQQRVYLVQTELLIKVEERSSIQHLQVCGVRPQRLQVPVVEEVERVLPAEGKRRRQWGLGTGQSSWV